MNDRLQLFFDNLEKIHLYFGTDADKFAKNLAVKCTVRNIRFFYEDYEKVQQQIKANTKWYQLIYSNENIRHAYFVHFAKTPDKIPHALHMYKLLIKQFRSRGEQSYLAATYMASQQSIEKMDLVIKALKKQSSLKYSNLSMNICAILASRPESPTELAAAYESYYQALVSNGFKRTGETKNCAVLLTLGTGKFCDATVQHLQTLTQFIKNTEIVVKVCHYTTITLLALAKFETKQFPALYDVHDEICRQLNIKKNGSDSLLIAAQIYTSNEVIGNLPTYELDFSDFMYAVVNDHFDGGFSGDSGGGE